LTLYKYVFTAKGIDVVKMFISAIVMKILELVVIIVKNPEELFINVLARLNA
jgi:hypothetical protein